jgi:hypothetical protein
MSGVLLGGGAERADGNNTGIWLLASDVALGK